MHKYLPLLILLGCCACDGNTAARKLARGANFVSDPDHLYFKNQRARHYRAEDVLDRATIYRHDDLFASPALLRPELVDNWVNDRAIIRFATDSLPDNWQLEVRVKDNWRSLPLNDTPTNEQLTALNDQLLGTGTIRIVSPADTLLAFPNDAGRAEARIVLNDFLRMVAYQP